MGIKYTYDDGLPHILMRHKCTMYEANRLNFQIERKQFIQERVHWHTIHHLKVSVPATNSTMSTTTTPSKKHLKILCRQNYICVRRRRWWRRCHYGNSDTGGETYKKKLNFFLSSFSFSRQTCKNTSARVE